VVQITYYKIAPITAETLSRTKSCVTHLYASRGTHLLIAGVGFNEQGRKTLAHPDYPVIQGMWHPTLNLGKLPADFTFKSNRKVWLRCPGCIHGCGRHHQWEAMVFSLTTNGGNMVCPSCESRGRGGRFCECQSVAGDSRLFKDWHPSNPHANQVAKKSNTKYLWKCPEGHPPYTASCHNRCQNNTSCPECGVGLRQVTHHPVVSVGRPDLAGEWDPKRNTKLPNEVTLGSRYRAWWVCRNKPEHSPWEAIVYSRALFGTGCPACRTINRFKPRQFGPL